jgi:hypothetical protein
MAFDLAWAIRIFGSAVITTFLSNQALIGEPFENVGAFLEAKWSIFPFSCFRYSALIGDLLHAFGPFGQAFWPLASLRAEAISSPATNLSIMFN